MTDSANHRPTILKHSSFEGLVETPVAARKSILIGRSAHCDVTIKDAKASREHCRLTLDGAGFSLEDLGSRRKNHK